MTDDRDEIRSRISIVELVSQRVNLKRSGKNWAGLCPFHNDKNPSFSVSDSTGSYRCWSCGEHGDIFTWVMKTQNVEFSEAMQILAEQAGITLKKSNQTKNPDERDQQIRLMEFSVGFFKNQLKASSVALEYCETRNLGDETIEKWELGYAPTDGHLLASVLGKEKMSLALAKDLFLVEGDSNIGYRDKFFGRLMFPIRDERGRLVALGGRVIGEGMPKYINSSDTPLYRKSRVLYGMHIAKDFMQKERRAVLVEGYLDVIACHRAGVGSAVASLGTALSEEQAHLLKRWVDEVVILYDSDAAGQKAADRAANILTEAGLKVRISLMPQGQDPDTLLREAGAGAVIQAVEKGISHLDFNIRELEQKLDPKSEEFWTKITELLATKATPKETEQHVLELASRYLPELPARSARLTILSKIESFQKKTKKKGKFKDTQPAKPGSGDRSISKVEALLLRAFLDPGYRQIVYPLLMTKSWASTSLARDIEIELRARFQSEMPSGEAKSWLSLIENEHIRLILIETEYDELLILNAASIKDCIQKLESQEDLRELETAKGNAPDDDRLRKIQEKLAKLKSGS